MNVYLNPEDLLLMAVKSGFKTTKELFDRGIVIIDRQREGAPLPRIRFRDTAVKCCPFLENRLEEDGSLLGLCKLHPDFKPLICGLAPLCREIDLDSDEEKWGFKEPYPGCRGCRIEKSEVNRCSEVKDPEIIRRLDSEKKFFIRLAGMLDEGLSEELIIEELYYRNCVDG